MKTEELFQKNVVSSRIKCCVKILKMIYAVLNVKVSRKYRDKYLVQVKYAVGEVREVIPSILWEKVRGALPQT